MKTYYCYCDICDTKLSNTSNALPLHLYHSHKEISKEQYYSQYIDSRTTCKWCKTSLKFINIQKGYADYCSSCATRSQWDGERGKNRKEILSNKMTGNTFSIGRPLGSKNKNPYPFTDAVTKRFKNYRVKDNLTTEELQEQEKLNDQWYVNNKNRLCDLFGATYE